MARPKQLATVTQINWGGFDACPLSPQEKMVDIKYCPHCNQNVNVVHKPTTTGLALCFLGFPFLVGADSMQNRHPWRAVEPKTALATIVILVVFFQVLVAIGWIIGVIALLRRRSYCPICRTPGKLLQPQR